MAFSQQAYDEQKRRFIQLRAYMAGEGPVKRIGSALKLDWRIDDQKQEILRWIMTVLAEIEKTLGDNKKDLTDCVPESYVQAMIDAATIGIPIDGRRLADLVPRGGVLQYQINTAGFVYLVGLHYQEANFKAGIVFDGDEFRTWTEDGYDHYEHKVNNPFEDDPNKMLGIYVSLSYRKGDIQHQKVERLSKSEIAKIKGKAKQNYIWNEWFFERAQTAAIKRIAKRQFQTIMGLQTAIEYDNKRNFDMSKALPPPSAGTIIDNLNARLAPPKDEALPPPEDPSLGRPVSEPEACAMCGGSGIIEDEAGKGPCPTCGPSAADRQTDQRSLL